MRDILIERELAYPRKLIWAALTDSQQLASWLMKNDFVPLVGHEFTFQTDPAPGFDGTVRCKVLTIEPGERLEMSWRGGRLDTVLTFELADAPTGTRLKIRHAGFSGIGNVLPRFFLSLGWRGKVLRKLAAVLSEKTSPRR
jgi:uncharacterized protein YndB with AHSA1/START domain